jgi:ATP-dependent RNA helicase HelY
MSEPRLGSAVRELLATVPFTPDPFQIEALAAIESGDSVVVTAPTGAGKTLIAQGAVHLALDAETRAFYTTPIKALSNQKFGEFRALYGVERVGLLTGDNVINGAAPVVVMTTEVLRNMIYADSAAMTDLGMVILDEVHYLQDRYRGPVWEEVIIHLPLDIPIVALSATIANAEEFTEWVRARRGPTSLVVERYRPVPLESLYLVEDRHHRTLILAPTFSGAGSRPNGEIRRLLQKGRGRYRRFATPRRLPVVERLAEEGLLPAIYFIFSRAGCEQAAAAVAGAGLGLTGPDERAAIASIVEERIAHLPPHDLDVLGYESWLGQLENGVAAHHAGMIPAFKEAVEDVFAAGLVKVVFATETLSLGINMPARSVVLESLSRFTGDAHELLQPGDYTQLTGRAGRRGIDTRGSAVVLHSPFVPFDKVADIAGAGSHALQSAFQPTYNMAVNLVANYDEDRAFELLRASFANFRQEEHRRALEAQLAERVEQLTAFRAAAECDIGDIWSFVDAEPAAIESYALWKKVQPGDVIGDGGEGRRYVVLARSWGGRSPQLMLLTETGEVMTIRQKDAPPALAVLGTLELPEPFKPRDRDYQREVALALREWRGDGSTQPVYEQHPLGPIAACPDLDQHLSWVRRARRAESEVARLRRRVEHRRDDLVSAFSSVLRLLADWGYVDGWELTERGERLRWVYNELDLLLTESVSAGHLAGLSLPQLAAVTSLFTFEARRADPGGGWPDATVAERGELIVDLWTELAAAEEASHLPVTRRPDEGFAAVVYAWALGADLDDLFADDEFAAGDFVRNCRQLLDLLRQLRDAFPELASTAAAAVRAIDRGIVAAGGRL